jgi:hypothetical protein
MDGQAGQFNSQRNDKRYDCLDVIYFSCYADTQIPARRAYGAKKFRTRQAFSPPCPLSILERGREVLIRVSVAQKATNARMGEAIVSGQGSLSLRDFGYLRNMSYI